MLRTRVLVPILVSAGIILILAACTGPTPGAPLPPTPTNASPQATPLITAIATLEPVGTSPTPTAPAPTATAAAPSATPASVSAPVITAQNAASLTPAALVLPEWPAQLFWPAPNVPLPAGLSLRPALLARAGNTLYPLQLDPPAVGKPLAFTLPGDQTLFFSPDLSSGLVLSQNTQPTLIDLNGKVLKTLAASAPYNASYSKDGKLVAVTSSGELAATIFDIASGQPVTKLSGFQTAAPVYTVEFVPGDQYIYWIARAGLQLQNIKTGEMGPALHYQDFIGPVAFTPDGQRMLLYVAQNLYLYSMPDLKELAHLTLSQQVSALSVSPDGTLLAAGYGPGIKFFDLGAQANSLLPGASLNGPNDATTQVAFSPDGRTLVSVHSGNMLEIWRAK